jgi:hypothetical protein
MIKNLVFKREPDFFIINFFMLWKEKTFSNRQMVIVILWNEYVKKFYIVSNENTFK